METKGERPEWVDPKLFPFESKWMRLEGNLVHYVDEGPRKAPVLLFVQPGAGWSFTYRQHIEQLRSDFRCVAPDLPGYGLSEAAEGYNFTLLEQSHILELFVKALDLQDIIAWGNDGGGPTAVLALAPTPERVRGLVVGGTFGWPLREYPNVARMVRLISGPIMRAFNRYTNFVAWSMTTKLALGTRSLTKGERRHYTRPFKDRNSRNHVLRLFASFRDDATQDELTRALATFRDKSALIQFGSRDAMKFQGWHKRWAAEIPDNRVNIIPHVAHFTFEGDPDATVKNFREWWAEIERRDKLAESLEPTPQVH
ncbi:MAG TPA: alpha/beta fold hydrolase [Nitrososphaerales archaeon]|nr:alpha/beta fold hydrolase [Nitrososphaerales archaeon]